MSHRRSIIAVVALALLALVLSATSRTSRTVTTDLTLGNSQCCCATDVGSDVAPACDCCGDDDAGPTSPCDCDLGGGEMPPLFPAPQQETIDAPDVERCAHTPTIPPTRGDLWRAAVDGRATLGPPIHVRHCVWLI